MLNRKHILFVFLFIAFVALYLTNKKHGEQAVITNTPLVRDLSQTEYEQARDYYMAIVHAADPRAALNELNTNIKNNDALARACHAFVHDIGHAAYTKYKDFGIAAQYQDPICISGYLHGVIESYFSQNRGDMQLIKSACNGYAPMSFLSAQCYHGAGHGFMYYTSNDLPGSLSLCDAYSNAFARLHCTNGVFMENFNTDHKIHPSKFLREGDLAYPCDDLEKKYKAICYMNAPLHFLMINKNDYSGALKWCEDAEPSYQASCAMGVGGEVIKENINNPKLVEAICMNAKFEFREPCIQGMTIIYITHFGSLVPAKTLCDMLDDAARNICEDTKMPYVLLTSP